jgi:hypothetical protein
MIEEAKQANFDGFALVEMMGHRRVAGYVTTEYIGSAGFLRVVTPEIPATRQALADAQYINGRWVAAGTVVEVSRPKQQTLVGAASIYAVTPIEETDINAHMAPTVTVIVAQLESPKPIDLAVESTDEQRSFLVGDDWDGDQ